MDGEEENNTKYKAEVPIIQCHYNYRSKTHYRSNPGWRKKQSDHGHSNKKQFFKNC